MLDQRGQLLRAALGFAGLPRPSYDRALWATDSEMKVERFTDYRRQYWTARYAGNAMLLMATPLFLEESRLDIHDSRLTLTRSCAP